MNVKLYTGDKREFFQSKYDYYKIFNAWSVTAASLASVTYFVSDCQLFGRFAWETLIPRMSILIPLLIFLILQKKTNDYRILVPASYLMIHGIMWCTIWAIYYLPIKTHASEGFIIMHLMFFAIGYCASFQYSTIAHSLVIVNILISNLFNHYENLDIMLSLGIPCLIAICAVQFIMGKVYLDHFQTKKRLEEALMTDPLTKAYNRNKLEDILHKNTSVLVYDNTSETSFMIIDIDHFKMVNDTFGHDIGDKVLIFTAEVIKRLVRNLDIVIRWGGEEFIVIMPGCPVEKAIQKADQIRKEVAATSEQICKITVSIGVSRYDGLDYFNAISKADKALYHAKESGRNCVIDFEEIQWKDGLNDATVLNKTTDLMKQLHEFDEG